MQREVPIWVAVVLAIVVVLIVAGLYYWRQPRPREGMSPPPTAPIFKAGPALNPQPTPQLPQEREGK